MDYSTAQSKAEKVTTKPPTALHASILYATSIHDALKATTTSLPEYFQCEIGFAWCDLSLLGIGKDTINTRIYGDELVQWRSQTSFSLPKKQWEPATYSEQSLHQDKSGLSIALLALGCKEICVYPVMVDHLTIGGIGFAPSQTGVNKIEASWRLTLLAEQCAMGIMNSISQQVLEEQFSTLEKLTSVRALEIEYGKQRVDLVLNNSFNAIVFTNAEGLIEQANDAFNSLLNCHPGAYINCELWATAQPEDHAAIQNALKKAALNPEPVQLDIQLDMIEEVVHVMLTISGIIGSDGCVGYVCSMQNISNRIAREADLRNKLAQERELNHMRSQFISMASHQFRTPLAIIAASTQSFVDYYENLVEDQRQQRISRIRRQIDRMTNLLDDVLMLSNLESHQEILDPKLISVKRLLDQRVPMYQSTINTHRFVHNSPDVDDTAIWADKPLLNHVIDQLVRNATHYSRKNSLVTISLMTDARCVMVSIKDEGIGIPQEEQSRIFESFYRGTNAIAVPGTGLGLAILKEGLRLLDGMIEMSSTIGIGTTMTIKLKKSTAIGNGHGPK